MLVEITSSGDDAPKIPLGLMHRIAAESWVAPETTKLGREAREVWGVYVDTFVREAVARCALAVKEGEGAEVDKEWIDVADLERVGAQLVLDF
jgi:hypothetical protein